MDPATDALPGLRWIWLGGLGFAALWLVVGVRIRYYRAYDLLAGYNTAPPAERTRYDVEGLADHVGNGLITMGVLVVLTTAALGRGSLSWAGVFAALFFAVVLLIVVGGRKFLPGGAHAPGASGRAEHRLLRAVLPERALRAVESGTRHWLIECPCGHIRDFWDAGGVRYKAVGEPRQLGRCPACGKARWHRVRKKRAHELGGPGRAPDAV